MYLEFTVDSQNDFERVQQECTKIGLMYSVYLYMGSTLIIEFPKQKNNDNEWLMKIQNIINTLEEYYPRLAENIINE